MEIFQQFLGTTGFANLTFGNVVMIVIGIAFITLAIRKHYEPLLLVPIGMGIKEPVITKPTNPQEAAENRRVEFALVKVSAETVAEADFDF